MKKTASTEGASMRGPRITDCVCSYPFQDHKYGKGKRVHNPMKNGGWRCTVCGREHIKGK